MTDIAIRVENLSKLYRIGQWERYTCRGRRNWGERLQVMVEQDDPFGRACLMYCVQQRSGGDLRSRGLPAPMGERL